MMFSHLSVAEMVAFDNFLFCESSFFEFIEISRFCLSFLNVCVIFKSSPGAEFEAKIEF